MADSEFYSPEAIIQANLAEGAARHAQICEQEEAHLFELAAEIAAGESLTAEFLASLPEHRLPPVLPTAPPREHLDRVWKCVRLCAAIRARLDTPSPSPEIFFPEADEPSEVAADRIAYRKNSYADRAYLRFSPLLPAPRAAYADTFEGVCERVWTGDCEYCILPLENSEEGRLSGFWRLIERYHLKIAATCDVPSAAHGQTTKFALLCLAPLCLPDRAHGGYLFECAISQDALPSVDLLYAAACCGLTVARAEAGISPMTHLTLCADADGIRTFLLYLATEAPDYTLIGYYPHIPNDRKDS